MGRPLQRAYLVEEEPTQPSYWQRVAAHVPGRSAQECFAKVCAIVGVAHGLILCAFCP